MGYIMEMSFNILKNSNYSELKAYVISLSIDYRCESFYDYVEMGSGHNGRGFHGNIQRNHCILVTEFTEDNILFFKDFLRIIQRMKDVYVECIYQDNVTCKLIYASPFYLKIMEKEKVEMYKKIKAEKEYNENDTLILEELRDRHRRTMTV